MWWPRRLCRDRPARCIDDSYEPEINLARCWDWLLLLVVLILVVFGITMVYSATFTTEDLSDYLACAVSSCLP